MLTDLEFLKYGKSWPPENERKRLETYQDNRLVFEDEHARVYKNQFERIDRVIGNFSQVISYVTILSYQKLMSLKIADLVFGEPPKITVADEKQQGVIDEILSDTDLLDAAYVTAIDVSRYGDGLMMLSKQGDKPVIEAVSPAHWHLVVEQSNIKRIKYHVFAWAYPTDEDRQYWELKVQIHDPNEPTKCEQHRYNLDGADFGWSIGSEITGSEEAMLETQLNVCPVFRVSNVITSDRVYGIDDYQSIDSIIAELIVRVSQISKVLDKHANPTMTGPSGALEYDSYTNRYVLKVGGYIERSDADPEPKYLTWDASMAANFQQIEFLVNQLYTISEMGSAIFGDLSSKTGQVPSGSALRRLMMSPLAKARRISNKFDPQLKRIISACAEMRGEAILPRDITIKWNDGLPDDEMENAQIMNLRTGNKPTISQFTAIQRLDGSTEKDTAAELEEIRADDAEQDMGTPPIVDESGELEE